MKKFCIGILFQLVGFLPIPAALTLHWNSNHFTQIFHNESSGGSNSVQYKIDGVKSRNPKIVGGQRARRGEFPYQLSLRYGDQHVCGAVIVDSRGAITAAHCVDKGILINESAFSVVGGEYKLDQIERGEQILRVTQIKVHPLYDPTELDNDIAYLHLEGEFVWSRLVRKIQIWNGDNQIPDTTTLTTTGWGWTEPDQPGLSCVLHKVDLPIVSNDQCATAYKEMTESTKFPITITDSMLCAGDFFQGHLDACKGDSGGPLVMTSKNKDRHGDRSSKEFLVGITSFGIGCGERQSPGVYTRVSKYKEWVLRARQRGQRHPQHTPHSECGGLVLMENQSELVYENLGDENETCIWVLHSSAIEDQIGLTLTHFNTSEWTDMSTTLHNGVSLRSGGKDLLQITNADLSRELILDYQETLVFFSSRPGQGFRFGLRELVQNGSQSVDPTSYKSRLVVLDNGKDVTTPLKYSYPKYPIKLYSANRRRYVHIKGVPRKKIKLIIDVVDLQDSQDKLEVYRISKGESKFVLLQTYKGKLRVTGGGTADSVQGEVDEGLLIFFQSDGDGQAHGFEITYQYYNGEYTIS